MFLSNRRPQKKVKHCPEVGTNEERKEKSK